MGAAIHCLRCEIRFTVYDAFIVAGSHGRGHLLVPDQCGSRAQCARPHPAAAGEVQRGALRNPSRRAPTSHCHMLDFPDPLPEAGEHCTEGPVCTLQAVWSGVGKAQACSLLGHTFRFGLWPMQKPCRSDLLEAYARYTDILVTMRCSTQRQVEMNKECFLCEGLRTSFPMLRGTGERQGCRKALSAA